MELKLIELPEPKRPQSVNRTDDPLYCPYHRLVSHQIIYCFVLKDKMKRLIADGDAELLKTISKGKRVASSNVTTYSCPTPSRRQWKVYVIFLYIYTSSFVSILCK